MRKNTKRSAVIAGVATVIIGGGVAAWANGWIVGGTGTGRAQAASIVELKATSDMGAVKVYPGLVTRVTVDVENRNEFPVKTTDEAVTPTGVTVTGGQNATACENTLKANPSMLVAKFDNGAYVGKGITAPVGSTVTIGDLPQDCVGSSFVVTYTFKALSA